MKTDLDDIHDIIKKIESPISFSIRGSSTHLSRIKKMEAAVTAQARRLLNRLSSLDPEHRPHEAIELSGSLIDLFAGYDGAPPQEKSDRLAKALRCISEIKSRLEDLPAAPGLAARGREKQGEGAGQAALSGPVQAIRGVGPKLSQLLARRDIHSIDDLLHFVPRQHEDRRRVCRIDELAPGRRQTVSGGIVSAQMRFYGKRRVFEVTIDDGPAKLKAKWFHGREAFLRRAFIPGRRVILTGETGGSPFEREMIHPDFEVLDDRDDQMLHFKRIIPIYSETEGLRQKILRRVLWQAVRDYAPRMESGIPRDVLERHRLMPLSAAIRQVHFPDNDQDIRLLNEFSSDAHRSLIFDEFFFYQLGMLMKRNQRRQEQGIAFETGGTMVEGFIRTLPFRMTGAQRHAIEEIRRDMASAACMNRLLQGDVGSGKTIVAIVACLIACENGYQAALMAPTEVLAGQHHRNVSRLLEQTGLRVALMTGSLDAAEKRDLQARVAGGDVDLVIGTHAVIQEGVAFRKLGLAVIDEQHRFGVIQRTALLKKGRVPDVLMLSATPIPRTLAMTVYGDLDISVLDEMPPGRLPVATEVLGESQRKRAYAAIRRELEQGRQVFVVYPVIQESERVDLRDAIRMSLHLQREVFPDYPLGLLHGNMRKDEKDRVLSAFMEKKTRLLVTTTVVEVGMDIPEASLIVVEHADRFGLSQLHQLRGRIGRGDIPSRCILMSDDPSDRASRRLAIMRETTDGFRIAEEDLAMRGPGEFMGIRQSGIPGFRVANIVRDAALLNEAKQEAWNLLEEDPGLRRREHQRLREELMQRWGSKLDLIAAG